MNNKIFTKIIACLDMGGCPNRCKHCWLGVTANGNLQREDLEYVASAFRPYAENIEISSWYREPDYIDNYVELWNLEHSLSTEHTNHFELLSFWRIVRDSEYVKWAYNLGVRVCQLTIFGMEEKTDYYIGRKGAFKEILQSIDILLEHKIAPRIQIFVNQDNISELPLIEKLINDLDLDNRCAEIGEEFTLFIHQGSCDGENEKLYDIRVTPSDINKIPYVLADYTKKYLGKQHIEDVFGDTEGNLYRELVTDNSTDKLVSESPVFYIDKDFNVYPNITQPAPWWCLGNLKTDGIDIVLHNYLTNNSIAQKIILSTPIGEMVAQCGNPNSKRLFTKDDYILYIYNQYCKSIETKKR